jgi:hypothetical protein
MDQVQVEVGDSPVRQLFSADGLDALALVEGLPEFADYEEIFTFDEAVFDGAGYALAAFDFVAVICVKSQLVCIGSPRTMLVVRCNCKDTEATGKFGTTQYIISRAGGASLHFALLKMNIREEKRVYIPQAPSNSLYPALIALYTVSAQVSLSTFHSPNPTCGIFLPSFSVT